MNGITEKNGIPYVWGVPCVKDNYYKFSADRLVGRTAWLCPHCMDNISLENEEMFCRNSCHLVKNAVRKSVFMDLFDESQVGIRSGKLFKIAIR
jgi:hypothetical protein